MVKNEYTHFCVTESLSNHGERFFTSYYEFCINEQASIVIARITRQ